MTKVEAVIIVGSGAAGVSTSLGVVKNGIKPLIIDVGKEPHNVLFNKGNIFEIRKKNNIFDTMVGENFQGLNNLIEKRSYPPKLTAPYTSYISESSEFLSPFINNGFTAIQSFAKGGLASAWGAGVYEYNNYELGNVPITASELSPYFKLLSEEIGISGTNDDLTPYFGEGYNLQKPIRLSEKSSKLLSYYQKKSKTFNRRGVFLGYPRLAVLTSQYNGRSACDYSNSESWFPNIPYIYNPAFTLNNLIKEEKVKYVSPILVKHWVRKGKIIHIIGKDLTNGREIIFKTKKLILAAGTINTSKIVLQSAKDYKTQLKLIDNPLLQIPVIFPGFVGKPVQKNSFGMTNLNIVFDFKDLDVLLQGSLIELSSPARGMFFEMFPFAAKSNIKLIQYLAPAAMVLFLYFPSTPIHLGALSLNRDNSLNLKASPYILNQKIIKKVIKQLYRLKIITHSLIIRQSPPGYAIHYAGTLPMSKSPISYQCSYNGKLHGENGVFIADGSLFPQVAAKNITFTIMANAMRIGDIISRRKI